MPATVSNALVLGAGAGTITYSLAQELPEATIESIEIEKMLFDISEKYFYGKMPENVTNIARDGRTHVRNSDKIYDFVYIDAFSSLYSIPYHLTTKEFYTELKAKMSDTSMLVTNTIGSLANEKFTFFPSIYKTICSIFDTCYVFVGVSHDTDINQNLVIVATKGDYAINLDDIEIKDFNQPELRFIHQNYIEITDEDVSNGIILTDDYAPVDAMITKIIQEDG